MIVIKYCRDLPKHKGQWYEPHECDTWWFEESDPNGGHPMKCGALHDPKTPDEIKAAWKHWMSHPNLAGCSHGC